jgi:hypothetical protein
VSGCSSVCQDSIRRCALGHQVAAPGRLQLAPAPCLSSFYKLWWLPLLQLIVTAPRPPCCSTGTSIANAINLGSALKVSQTGDSSNYPDTALSGCADPTDFNNGTKGDGGDVVSSAGHTFRRCLGWLRPQCMPAHISLSGCLYTSIQKCSLPFPKPCTHCTTCLPLVHCSTTSTPWQPTVT